MWVLKHHTYEENHMFHVAEPLEIWLETILNELNADVFNVLPEDPKHPGVTVVAIKTNDSMQK